MHLGIIVLILKNLFFNINVIKMQELLVRTTTAQTFYMIFVYFILFHFVEFGLLNIFSLIRTIVSFFVFNGTSSILTSQ